MTYWAWIVGAVPCALIVENYAVVGLRCAALWYQTGSSRQVNSLLSAHLLGRRQLLQGAMAAALPLSLYGCAGDKGAQARAADRRWPARHLQSHAAGRLHREGREHQGGHGEQRFRVRVQQVQRLAGDQRVADVEPHPGRVHARAAGHGSRRQEDSREDRVAGSSLGRGDHGAHGFGVSEIRRSQGQAHRHPEPLRRGLPVPAQDAHARKHDAGGHRDRGDAAARHAGGVVCQRGGRVLHG